MSSFGEKLKHEREKRSITLEQISLSTKIGTRMLQALEEDKFSQLPGGIFNKGFVRAYARFVGLDEEQAVADYLEASGEAVPTTLPEIKAEAAPPERPEPTPSRPLPWGLFAALLLLVALALALWSRRQHNPGGHSVPAPVTAPTSTTPTPASIPSSLPPSAAPASTAEPAPVQPAPATAKPAVADSNTHSPAAGTAKPSSETVAASSPSEPGQFTLVILAREDCWLSISKDGASTFTTTLLAGDQRAIHAGNQIVVKSGNTGALDFVFNGKKLPSQGGHGEVKTLVFSAAGLEPTPPPPAPAQ